ncbi:hypothetical protein VTH06DRAFT_5127 [Thermothelomyces fergusii]
MGADETRVVDSDKIWATLITKDSYLPGLLALAFSLRQVQSRYPLVALHTGTLSDGTVRALAARGIPLQRVPYIDPGTPAQQGAGAGAGAGGTGGSGAPGGQGVHGMVFSRFRDCFTKLVAFSLAAYSRIVLLDADMLVRRNMDELFDFPICLQKETLNKHTHTQQKNDACICNPFGIPIYPADWTPANCAFTQQHADPAGAQTDGGSPADGRGNLNAGLLVLAPGSRSGAEVYRAALAALAGGTGPDRSPLQLPFAEQSLLCLLFPGRWVALPYVYNALGPMRLRRVHGAIWRDDEVRNVHYILTPKPWEKSQDEVFQETQGGDADHGDSDEDQLKVLYRWWWEVDAERRAWEAKNGIGS